MSLTANEIIDLIAVLRGVRRQDLLSDQRAQHILHARHELHDALRQLTGLSFAKIGEAVGKDHTCIVSSMSRVEALREDPIWRQHNDDLIATLREIMMHRQTVLTLMDAEDSMSILRRAASDPASSTITEIMSMGITMLTLSSVIGADRLTDADARCACRGVLASIASTARTYSKGA